MVPMGLLHIVTLPPFFSLSKFSNAAANTGLEEGGRDGGDVVEIVIYKFEFEPKKLDKKKKKLTCF